MFHKWMCTIWGKVEWEKEITDTEAYAEAVYYTGKYKDCDVLIDVRHHEIMIGDFCLG